MQRYRTFQTIGSLAVFGSFAAAEAAALYLDAVPGSPLAWYLNLEVFGPFEAARNVGSPLHILFGPQALCLHASLLALTLTAHLTGIRFATALLCNLAMLATAMLAHAWFFLSPHAAVASLRVIDLRREPDLLLVGLCATSTAACILSHVGFTRTVLEQDVRSRLGRDVHAET